MSDPLSELLGAESSMLRRPVGDPPSTPPTPAVHQESAAAALPADDRGHPDRVVQLLSRLAGASGIRLSITRELGLQAQQGVQQHAGLPGEAPLEAAAAELGAPGIPSLELVAGAAEEGRAAEIAAAHRLTTNSIDFRAVAGSIEKGLPFTVLLVLVFVSHHIIGLTAFGWLSYVLFRLNQVLRQQVALSAQLQPAQCTAAGVMVVAHVLVVLLITWPQRFWRNLVLVGNGEPVTEFWEVLFDVVVVDTLVRYLAVLSKVALLLVSRVDSAQLLRRRGHALTAVEYMFAFYRGLLPIPLWYGYFKEAPSSMSALFSTITSGLYLMLKCTNVYDRLAAATVALRQAWLHSAYGSAPSQDEISEAGNSCPICQDNLRGPVKLHCGHIFCDDCVSEWLERERTCPMCRAAIRPSNLLSYADGRTTMLPIVF